MTLDGAAVGRIAIDRGASLPPIIAIDALAEAEAWKVIRLAGGERLVGDDRNIRIMIGSRSDFEDSASARPFIEAPVERDGHVYLNLHDAARVLGLRFTRTERAIALQHPEVLDSRPPTIVEVAAPPAPRPRATPATQRSATATASVGAATAGRIVLSMDRTGATTALDVTGTAEAGFVHSTFEADGVNRLDAPMGTVTIGSSHRSLALGALSDPMSGLIFRGNIDAGADFHDARGDVFLAHRLADGSSIAGYSEDLPGGGSDALAVLLRNGRYEQTFARRLRIRRSPWGTFTSEYVVGQRGAGAAFHARTRGRTFVESTVSYAMGGLPLGPNDAPISVDVGRDLSRSTTVAGGLETGRQQPLGPFLAFSTRSAAAVATVTVTNRAVSGSLSYQAGNALLQGYAIPGPLHASGLQGQLALPLGTLNLATTSAADVRDGSLEFHTASAGIRFVAGIGVADGGRPGPIAGVVVPVSPLLAVEATLRPVTARSAGFRLSLAIGIPRPRARAAPTLTAIVRVASAGPLPPLRLYVDHIPRRYDAATGIVRVEAGVHVFAVESQDGTLGSLDASREVAANGDSIDLALLPERAISGRVQLDAPAIVSLGPDASVAGIVVVVEPGGVSTETAADGTFVFAKQPFPPDATIRIDAGSLPRTLRAPGAVPLGGGEVLLTVGTALPIERSVFH